MAFLIKTLIFFVFVALAHTFENCTCPWRYFKHYEAKDCFLEKSDSCGCPQKFICPNETQQAPAKVCVYQNKEYKVGSKIITSHSCQVCRCREGVPPYIYCVAKDCPEIEDIPGKDCHLVYKDNKCCPTGVECLENDIEITANKTCEYEGKYYPFGSKIYPDDDPCLTCTCDENWNGVDNASCHQQDCLFEKDKPKLSSGCIPVYHESRCCPIEFYCPSTQNFSYSVLSNNESSDNFSIPYDDQCRFDGQFFEVGEELYTDNPCVKCKCVASPDLTCVHQTCSLSPNEENCQAIYTPGECCPSYECMLGDTEAHPDGCPTPLCADSTCRIEIPPGHQCPTCVCGERYSELEHNNLEQVQQISQNMEQFELVGHDQEPRSVSDDYSDGELQMMPMRMPDSESQHSVMEKMVEPDPEYDQAVADLHKLDEYSAETGSLPIEKRDSPQQTMLGYNEDIEREGGMSEKNNGDFEDELESFRNRIFSKNKTIINQRININHEVKVPPGCPTPMCEGPWCRIGIPPGEKCPTCICKRPGHSDP